MSQMTDATYKKACSAQLNADVFYDGTRLYESIWRLLRDMYSQIVNACCIVCGYRHMFLCFFFWIRLIFADPIDELDHNLPWNRLCQDWNHKGRDGCARSTAGRTFAMICRKWPLFFFYSAAVFRRRPTESTIEASGFLLSHLALWLSASACSVSPRLRLPF